MVTVFHLHRYVRFLRSQLSALDTVRLSSAVASWVEELEAVCSAYEPVVDDDHVRRRMIEDLGRVADAQSRRLLAGARADLVETPASRLIGLLDRCLVHLDATMQRGQRPDGLVDSYNLLSFPDPESACIDRLGPMLEGQYDTGTCIIEALAGSRCNDILTCAAGALREPVEGATYLPSSGLS